MAQGYTIAADLLQRLLAVRPIQTLHASRRIEQSDDPVEVQVEATLGVDAFDIGGEIAIQNLHFRADFGEGRAEIFRRLRKASPGMNASDSGPKIFCETITSLWSYLLSI